MEQDRVAQGQGKGVQSEGASLGTSWGGEQVGEHRSLCWMLWALLQEGI